MTIDDIGVKLWFRPDVRGLAHVPADGPVLLVAPRSGGRRNVEAEVLHLVLRSRADAARDLVVATTPGEVAHALDNESVVLVQPADSSEAYRPTWEPPRLDRDAATALFAPAVARGVPVVPVAVAGGQDTALFLSRGDRLTRRLHLDRAFHLERLPLSLTVPWGLGVGAALPNVPLPARVAVEVLAPLAVVDRLGEDPDPTDVARWATAAVESAVDAMLDVRRPPFALPAGLTRTARVLVGSGLAGAIRPAALARVGAAIAGDGFGLTAAYRIAATRFAGEPAVIDDEGSTTFAELSERIGAFAAALHEQGVDAGSRVGVLSRNGRAFVEAIAAVSRLGADVVLLNTSFAGPQLADVIESEHVNTIVADPRFAGLLGSESGGPAIVLTQAGGDHGDAPTLGEMVEAGRGGTVPGLLPASGRFVLLTSGTTGRPKGAARPAPVSLDPVVALLDRIPLHQRDVTLVASPLFHAWGFAHLALGALLSSTLVLLRTFDAEATLAAVEKHGVRVLVAVPVMLQRLMQLPAEVRARYDLSSLEVVAVSGSALPGDLALLFMDAFGEVLYNLYGSTEAAWAGIATPRDLRAEPATAGRPPANTEVHLLDAEGRDVPTGATGRILVRNVLAQQGTLTTASPGHVPQGLVATGDVGHIDEFGRLYVEGREDDMIVSGGENVYPQEVEDVLMRHWAVADVAVVGVRDEEFGQRLTAVVVREPGARLTARDVQVHVRANLARFKVPRDVTFVDELPRNATGKVVRGRLRS